MRRGLEQLSLGAGLHVAEIVQQMAVTAAVASISLAKLGHALEVLMDHLIHPAAQQVRHRLARALAVVLALCNVLSLHRLHHPKRSR